MNDHDAIRNDLVAYAAARLDEPSRKRVEAHLEACESCRETAMALNNLATSLRDGGMALFEPHPTEAELREYAAGSAGVRGESIGRHLDACASCSIEVETLRRISQKRAGTESSRAGARGSRWGSLGLATAAGVVLGFGLAFVLRGAFMPPPEMVVEAPPQAPATASPEIEPPAAQIPEVGPLLLLPPAVRGETSATSCRLMPGQQALVLACPAAIPDDAAPQEEFRYEIRTEGGGVVWHGVRTAAEIREHREATEVVTLILPTAILVPGRYELRLTPAARPGELLYRALFEITAPKEPPS